MSYKVEVVDKKDSIVQLEVSKLSIKDLFIDLLNETRGFKYQITVKVLLKKYKPNGEIEFTPVYFNSSTKTVINRRYMLKFQTELMHGLIKDQGGLLNQLSLNTLIFQLIDHQQEVLTQICQQN